MKTVVFVIALLALSSSCDTEVKSDQTKLEARLDSLQSVLSENNYALALLDQVGVYLDSIDTNRKWIKLDLETGIQEMDYIERMKNLNLYTQKAEWTIGELEKTRSAYASQVKRLKREMVEKEVQIQSLQLTISEYQAKNTDLENLLTISKDELMEAQIELDFKGYELDEADIENNELYKKLLLSDAEILYAKGEGMELAANHIEFAPRRKREMLEKALDHYNQAFDIGYPSAKEKIGQIKNKLKID